MIHTIDLHFLKNEQTIAAFLLETPEGPVLIESGPYSTFPQLEKGIRKCGYQTSDIKKVFLTHIHLDHAGAAWALAEKGATIYVHPFGFPHMADPGKLLHSAKRIYQDDMDRLWSDLKPIPVEKLVAVEDMQIFELGDQHTTLKARHTPGHAHHHIAWQFGNVLFTGDVAGVKIGNGPVVAPCPPPDIDLEKWESSLQLITSLGVEKLYLTHYGTITDIDDHLAELRENLKTVSEWVKKHIDQGMDTATLTPLFDRFVNSELERKGVSPTGLAQYQAANPAWMSVAGLVRYWKKKEQAA